MKYYHDFEKINLKNTVVMCGKFDGIHLGHQALLNTCLSYKKEGLKSVVFTFDASIAKVLPNGACFINSTEERVDLLRELGVDYLAEYSFEHIAKLHPDQFVRTILVGELGAKVVVVGEDFRFGFKRAGDVELLRQLQDKYNYELKIVPKVENENGRISSSKIREAIQMGNMELATNMLGHPYFVEGQIVHGKKLGRTIGMPTANVPVPEHKLLPPKGVYVSMNYIDNKAYGGITNIGTKPTVDGSKMGVETYLFDFDKDVYGEPVKTEFLHYVRPEQKFGSVEELSDQMHQDAGFGKQYLNEYKLG